MVGSKFRPVFLAAALLTSAPLAPASAQVPAPYFAPHELDALVAPIALYPDGLLANVLMASSYPIEVVAAVRWLNRPGSANLGGDELIQMLDRETWDPSVKALTAVPQVLRMMDSRLDWMERLGDAFVADQAQVMEAVQRLRRQARDNGTLRTDGARRVVDRDGAIVIEPASSQVVSLEVYEPATVYGNWLYPEYPPTIIPPPSDYGLAIYSVPLIVPLWGWSSWDWRRHRINLDVPRWRDLDRHHSHIVIDNAWQHDPGRRREFRGNIPGAPPPTAALTPVPNTSPTMPQLTPGDPRRGRFAPSGTQQPATQPPAAPTPGLQPPVSRGDEPRVGRRRFDDDRREANPNALGMPPQARIPTSVTPAAPQVTPTAGFRTPQTPVFRAPLATPPVSPPPAAVLVAPSAPAAQPAPHPLPMPPAAGEPKVACSPGARCAQP